MASSLFRGDPFDKKSPYKTQERARRRRLIRAISTGVIPGLSPIVILLGIALVTNPSWQIAVSFTITLLIILLSWVARTMADRDQISSSGYVLAVSFLFIVGVNGLLIRGFAPAVAPSYTVIVVK